jgi:hypothetical protein
MGESTARKTRNSDGESQLEFYLPLSHAFQPGGQAARGVEPLEHCRHLRLGRIQCFPRLGDGTGRRPTLADRIKAGPIPSEEALPIAKQISETLEYAHEHGIVYRDLKPANIEVTRDDAVDNS